MSTTAQSFNPADAVVDESDGRQSITALLAAYAKYSKGKYPNAPANQAPRPYIDGAIVGTSNADLGINDEMVANDGDGVLVIVPAYPGMKAGQRVTLSWNDNWVSSSKVSDTDLGSYLTLRVLGKDVPKGRHTLLYHVFSDNTLELTSATSTTFYRDGQPGVDGAKGRGEDLAAPTVALPGSKVIGPAEASAKVKVTIAPYLSMHESDRIRLFWGDSTVDHLVTKAEVGKPIVIMVDERLITQAGDSSKLPVYYFVTDEVGNESEWSADALVNVQLQATVLQAPVLMDTDGKVNSTGNINISELQADHLLIQINGQFQAGDSVVLNWNGTSSGGQVIPATYGPEVVSKTTTQLTFKAPLNVLTALSGGSTRLTYTVTRNGTATTSQAAFFDIAGVPVGLAPLSLNKDKNLDFWIDADHAVAHALIPVDAALQEEDEVTVIWTGTKSDTSVVQLRSTMFRVTAKKVGKLLPIQLSGKKFVKPFDGGWVDVYYQVKRGNETFYSEKVRYFIGSPAETLAPPFTETPLVNNMLNPDLPEYEYDLQISIPPDAVKPTPCTITLYWETSDGVVYEDEQILQASDGLSPFLMPADLLQVKGDKPVKVWVYYIVEWDDEKVPNKASADLVFTIANTEMMKKLNGKLTIPSTSNGTLDLGKVPQGGLVVEIPHYQGMAIGDKISIKFGETIAKVHTVTEIGKQTATLTPAELALLKGQKDTVMTYEVERYPSGEKFSSQPTHLKLEGELAKYPIIEQFDKYSTFFNLQLNKWTEFDTLHACSMQGHGSVYQSTDKAWLPTWGGVIFAGANATIRFRLKATAKRVSFDIADSSRVPSTVRFYGANNALIGTIKTPAFSNTPAPGYTIYSTNVSFTSPSEPIQWFEFVDGGGDSFVDNIVISDT